MFKTMLKMFKTLEKTIVLFQGESTIFDVLSGEYSFFAVFFGIYVKFAVMHFKILFRDILICLCS